MRCAFNRLTSCGISRNEFSRHVTRYHVTLFSYGALGRAITVSLAVLLPNRAPKFQHTHELRHGSRKPRMAIDSRDIISTIECPLSQIVWTHTMPQDLPDSTISLYALRRTLPKWCFDERLEELREFCGKAHVDEVILKIDSEEFSHGMPTLQWAQEYVPMLARAKQQLEKIGVVFSLNPWVTQGHVDRGRDLRDTFSDFHWMVGHDGTACHAQACPRCESFQSHITKLWSLYATLQPRVLWVEDDIRTFNHLPARFACFCDQHMDAFAQRAGLAQVRRQDLVEKILHPGKPHPWRALWFDLQRDTMRELCGKLEQAIHTVSPETTLGLMSSGPANHCLDGRNWQQLAEALSDNQKRIYSRPTLGNYIEESAQGLYDSAAQIQRTRFVLPAQTIEQTEVENVPFTQYANSSAFTAAKIAISIAHGCSGVSLNLFDHLGSPLATTPEVATMLCEQRPTLDALRSALNSTDSFTGRCLGVRILHHERAADARHLQPASDYADLIPPDYAFESALNKLGIPTTYTDSPVVVMEGQMVAAYSNEELEEMFKGGVLLDATALGVLQERGLGALVGANLHEIRELNTTHVTAVEALTDESFGGASNRFLSLTLPSLSGGGQYGFIEPHKDATTASWIVDEDRQRVAPMLTLFENNLGGRVAVMPLVMASSFGNAFLHPFRKAQLEATLKWISRNTLPITIHGGVYPLAIGIELDHRYVLSAFNLSRDPWANVTWKIACDKPQAAPTSIEVLAPHANVPCRVEQQDNLLTITLDHALPFGTPISCVVHFDKT